MQKPPYLGRALPESKIAVVVEASVEVRDIEGSQSRIVGSEGELKEWPSEEEETDAREVLLESEEREGVL